MNLLRSQNEPHQILHLASLRIFPHVVCRLVKSRRGGLCQVKHNILLELSAEDLVLRVDRQPCTDALGLVSSHSTLDALDTSYVDDDAIVVVADNPADLLPRARRAAEVVCRVYRRFRFRLNFSKGKSEAIFAFRGKDSKRHRVEMAAAGAVVRCMVEGEEVAIRVVHRYVHLGTVVNCTGAVDMEIANRVGIAKGALVELRRVFKMELPISTNLLCIRLYVFSKLFYGAAAWPTLSKRNLTKVRTVYLQAHRLAVNHGYDGCKPSMSNEALVAKYEVAPVEVVLACMRLRFYSKLVVNASEAMRTVLSALVEVPSSYSFALVADFVQLRLFSKLQGMPCFTADPHKWADMCDAYGAEFRSIVALWAKSKCGKSCPVDVPSSLDVLPVVARSDPFLPHRCLDCPLGFASVQALGQHRRRAHGFMNPIRRSIWGSKCPVCEVQFHTRPRLLQHLSYDSASCKAIFLDGEPVVLPLELVLQLDAADAAKSRANRRAGLPERFADCPAD